jgi:serine-type D-Ala-D-Ala carboxypeptidase (penicillin-binding protein 5/6)
MRASFLLVNIAIGVSDSAEREPGLGTLDGICIGLSVYAQPRPKTFLESYDVKRFKSCLLSILCVCALQAVAQAQPVPQLASPQPVVPQPQAQARGPLPIPAAPELPVKSYVLMDFDTGSVLANQQADLQVEPASITKVMAAYVVFHELRAGRLQLTEPVPISEKAWRMEGSRMFAKVGDTIPAEQLILGMIVQSGNDSTIALAEHIAGSEASFVSVMNDYAKKIGMQATNFTNAAGMPDAQHYTTATDIARLARQVVQEFPEYYKWYSVREYTWNNIRQYNRNQLLARDASVDGMKTGHTASAGYCLVSSAKRGEMRLIAVVMGAESEAARTSQSQSILNYGFRFFETHQLYAAGTVLSEPVLWKGDSEKLGLGLSAPLRLVIPRGHYERLSASMELVNPIVAPIEKGKVLGTVRVRLGKELLAERPLVALNAGPEGGFLRRMGDGFSLWWQSE